jgi:ketosteroid isomerase-like protein
MSEENVELVRQLLNTWIEVDERLAEPDRLNEFFAPDMVFDTGGLSEVAGRGEVRGLDEWLELRAEWFEAYEDWDYSPEKILDAGANDVVVTYHQRGKPRGSDSWVEMRYGMIYTVEEGLIRRVKVCTTPEEALEAAGLRE